MYSGKWPKLQRKLKSGGFAFIPSLKVTVPDAYPISYVRATLDKLRASKYLSTLDKKSAYWQIPVSQEPYPPPAFTAPSRGLYQFKRIPYGLSKAPAVCRVLGVDLEPSVFVYLDDVRVCTSTFENHL